MNAFTRFATLSLSLVAVVACGKPGGSGSGSSAGSATVTSGPAPKGGSCNEEQSGICVEYGDNPLGMAEGACKEMFHGTYSKGSCPQQNALGYCQKKEDKEFYYFGNGVAAWVDDAREDCEKNPLTPGKFTAAPNAEQTAKDKAIPTPDRISASCQHKDGTCDDITGRLADLEKSFCEDGGNGTYTEHKACAADALVGSCVKHSKVSRYYTPSLKTQSAKDLTNDCENGLLKGHWYPGPAAPAAAAAKAAAPAAKAAGGKATPAGGAAKAKTAPTAK